MYIVDIINDEFTTRIHGKKEKLKSGNVVKGINAIDSFSFTILPTNSGFSRIKDYKTIVKVFNTNKNRYEFLGRVLYSNTTMSESGLITKEVTCESYFGFLQDSVQSYVEEQNWTVSGLLEHIINDHNSQVEPHKQFVVGDITVEDPNDNLYCGIQRESTWKTISDKLISVLGGEIRLRVENGINYIDYLKQIGTTRATEIKLSKNMKSISKEQDPSAYITRLIPLGAKLKVSETTTDEEGNETITEVETEQRLDITSVNNGINYIEDEAAKEQFGIRVGIVTFDDVTEASNLLAKGKEYLANNNKVQIKYSITALDLSLLKLDIDDFDICNYHPIKNKLLGIDDVARIIKKNIDVCEEIKSTIEVGDSFKTLSEIQREQAGKIENAFNTIQNTKNELKDYVGTLKNAEIDNLKQTIVEQTTELTNTCNEIIMSAMSSYVEVNNGVTVTGITKYYLATSAENVSIDEGEWVSETIPDLTQGNCNLWCYEQLMHSDTRITNTQPYMLSAYNGAAIQSITEYYGVNSDRENPTIETIVTNEDETQTTIESDLDWLANEIPSMSMNAMYLWNYSVITYTDGTTSETEKRLIDEYSYSYSELSEIVKSQLQILSNSISINIEQLTKRVNEVDGDLQSKFNTISKYFSFDIDGLKIGSTYTDDNGVEQTSPFTIVIDEDEFLMKYMDNDVIRLDSQGQSHIPDLKITEELNLFGYKISEDNGKVNLEYIG